MSASVGWTAALLFGPRNERACRGQDEYKPDSGSGIFGILVIVSTFIACRVGYQPLDLSGLWNDEIARSVFFRLRLPRVVMAGLIGSTLALTGGALQALFRNSLADPFILGVSGGGALGARCYRVWLGRSSLRHPRICNCVCRVGRRDVDHVSDLSTSRVVC